MVNLAVDLCGVKLKNPVVPASGTFGFGYEFNDIYDINVLGAISIKGTTKDARFGNPTPRIAECTSGLINSIGLQNPGIDAVIEKEIPRLREVYRNPIISNISGFSIDEYVYCCEKINAVKDVDIIEVNISCPNVHNGGMSFGTLPENAEAVTKAVKKVTTKPVFIKLTPNVTDIVSIAKACEQGGADGISLINTSQGLRIDLNKKKPVIANKIGGFSGRAIFPIALKMVWQVYEAVKLPIMGIGGVATAEDVIEMMMAGATAVQVGAENLVNPYACSDIINSLPSVMEKYKINDLNDIIGVAHK
ncbi:MAG: dihydroorotate dehydrogenase [Clostridiales bacterium]|nr:dihydroorotate dehydrogenase [Clostridiales bacterium]